MNMDDEREHWPALEAALDEEVAGGGPAASADSLRGILTRHTRRRRRFTTGIAATVLAFGLGGGVAIGEVVASTGGTLAANSRAAAPSAVAPGARQPGLPHFVPTKGGAAGLHVVYGTAQSEKSAALPTVPGASHPSASCRVSSGCNSAVFGFQPMKKLFDRTANGVTIRSFTLSFPVVLPLYPGAPAAVGGGSTSSGGGGTAFTGSSGNASSGAPAPSGQPSRLPSALPLCYPTSQLEVEVSDAGAIGQFTVPLANSSSPLAYVDEQVFGTTEGSPMAVVAVRVGKGVTAVAVRFGSGVEDVMTTVKGWAVLATTLPTGAGTSSAAAVHVEALTSSGAVSAQVSITQAPAYAFPEICAAPLRGSVGGSSPPVSTGSAPATPAKPATLVTPTTSK